MGARADEKGRRHIKGAEVEDRERLHGGDSKERHSALHGQVWLGTASH